MRTEGAFHPQLSTLNPQPPTLKEGDRHWWGRGGTGARTLPWRAPPGSARCPSLSHTKYRLKGFGKSTPPPNRQLKMINRQTISWWFCGGVDVLKPVSQYIVCDKSGSASTTEKGGPVFRSGRFASRNSSRAKHPFARNVISPEMSFRRNAISPEEMEKSFRPRNWSTYFHTIFMFERTTGLRFSVAGSIRCWASNFPPTVTDYSNRLLLWGSWEEQTKSDLFLSEIWLQKPSIWTSCEG